MSLGSGADLLRAVTESRKEIEDVVGAEMATMCLSLGEADVLTVVLVARDYAATPSEIADWLSVTTAGTTGRLNSLSSKGLIERRPHASDGRSLTVHLTAPGRKLAKRVVATKDEVMRTRIVERLGTDAAAQLVRDLDALIDAARSDDSNAGR